MRHTLPAKVLSALLLLLPAALPAFAEEAGRYWSRPINGLSAPAPQTGAGAGAAGAYPKDCAQCHGTQYDDWSKALHSRSVGPGLTAQLDPYNEPGFAMSCYYCHAPLTEQSEVVGSGRAPAGEHIKNPGFDKRLQGSGVNCGVCHMREGIIYGPLPSKEGEEGMGGRGGGATSGGERHASVQKDFFSDAAFCAACHQMDSGFKLNGKLLMNTYREWRESKYARDNVACQGCHMPGRRHLFRGIHDPEMVRSGIRIETEKGSGNRGIKARLRITNSAVGHMFPTYVTPSVVVSGFLTDAEGARMQDTVKEAVIARRVTLDLSQEVFDTRIPPQGTFSFDYETRVLPGARALVFEIRVFPDEFYNRFFSSLLEGGGRPDRQAGIEEALRNTETDYLLYRKEFGL